MANILEHIIKSSNSLLRKTALSTAALIAMNNAFSQEPASGTIRFNTIADTSINGPLTNAQAEKIAGADIGTTYAISGNVNQDIPFGPWISEALGVDDFKLGTDYLMFKNPTSEPDVIVKNEVLQGKTPEIYNMLGQKIASVKPKDLFNGTSEIYTSLEHQPTGMYFMKIGNNTIKFIKNDTPIQGPRGSSNLSSKLSSPSAQSKGVSAKGANSQKTSGLTGNENYNISWGESDLPGNTKILAGNQLVEVFQGNANAITVDANVYENKTGDVAYETILNGLPKSNVKLKLIKNDNSVTYTIIEPSAQAIFYDVSVLDNVNGDAYTLEAESTDDTFEITTKAVTIFQDEVNEGGVMVNGSQQIILDGIANEQARTIYVYNKDTMAKELGETVEVYRALDNSLVDSKVTDGNGKVDIVLPGNDSYYLKISKPGHYTKTNGTFNVPLVDLLTEKRDTMNVTTVPYFNYEDNTHVEASRIQLYKLIAAPTELALGKVRVYFPDIPGGNQVYKDHFAEVATALGKPGAIIPSDTAFPDPKTNGTYETYDPRPGSRQVHDGLIGVNITNYNGTSAGIGTKDLPTGEKIAFYTTTVNLGGLNWAQTDHEIGNIFAFSLITNTTSYASSRDLLNPIPIADSKSDKAIMPFWIDMTTLRYDTTDTQGRVVEYSMATKYEE